MYTLTDFISREADWRSIFPAPLHEAIRALYERHSMADTYAMQSRTLKNVLMNTVGYYGQSQIYTDIAGICSLAFNNRKLTFKGHYNIISSEQANNLSLGDIIHTENASQDKIYIHLYHIPKGKSYVRELLDKTPDLNRLKQIETFCIENPYHFVRIYQGIGFGMNPWDIVIFSDTFSEHFIQTLLVMLPNMLQLQYLKTTEEHPELDDEDETYNKRLGFVYAFFTQLFKIYSKEIQTDAQLQATRVTIKTILTNYKDCFDFTSAALNDFLTNLANARNNSATRYYTNQLSSLANNIERMEHELQNYYVRQTNLQRELIAINTLNRDEVKPFVDTITNSPNIEILNASTNQMLIRVTAPLQYFRSEDFEAYERNEHSTYNAYFRNSPTLKNVLHKVFVTHEYKLLVQSIIELYINNNDYSNQPLTLNARTNNSTDFTEFPNPHLYHHNCWAAAKNEINKHICEGKFELAVMQIIAAVQTVNIAENASFVNGFLRDVLNSPTLRRKMTFIDKDQNKYTYDQILEHEQHLQQEQQKEQAKQIIENAPKNEYTQVEIEDNDDDWDDPVIPNF